MTGETDESKRKFLKVVALGGVAVAATPLLMNAKSLGLGPQSDLLAAKSETQYPAVASSESVGSDAAPLIVVVKDGQVTGYRGTQKVSMNDQSLVSRLHSSFESNLK
jgi:hypothetical protein